MIINVKELGYQSVNCIHLDQDVDQLRALVNTEQTFGFRKMTEIC
jgi:hypothetical protein